jgi:2-methylisocitrate lyase-like PEP mutase family enzyme
VVSVSEMVKKIKSAVKARKVGSRILNVKTDSPQKALSN